jgi:hypothetical protein
MRPGKLLTAIVLIAVSFGASAAPLTDSTRKELTESIEKNWNIPTGMPNIDSYTITLRVHLSSSGAVTQIDVPDSKDDPNFRSLVESARRAVLLTQNELGRLPIPADQLQTTVDLRWDMKTICAQLGC